MSVLTTCQGFAEVPSFDVLAEKFPSYTQQELEAFKSLLSHKGLLQALPQAVLVSPLTAFLGLSYTNHVCKEETLVVSTIILDTSITPGAHFVHQNVKWLGNENRSGLLGVEDQAMTEILRTSEGKQSSVATFLKLQQMWREAPPILTPEEDMFYARGKRYSIRAIQHL